jgi:hypothetical protein
MNKTKTASLDLELPPQGGNLSAPQDSLEDEAHALRVLLDRSENMKVSVGQILLRLLETRFAGNRNALRDWYEAEVAEGKVHRAWTTVVAYLGAVKVHGEDAATVISKRDEWRREYMRDHDARQRADATAFRQSKLTTNAEKSDYERRADWLAQMNYQWFKGEPEWQNKWLQDRNLSRTGFRSS